MPHCFVLQTDLLDVQTSTDQRTALCDAWLLELHRQAHHSVDFESFSARVLALLGARQSVRARLQLRPAK